MMARGRVVVIIGPKGGVGKSTLAVNLAASLAAILGRAVGLVDLDGLSVGDVAKFLRAVSTMVSTFTTGSLNSLEILLKSKSVKGFLKAPLAYMDVSCRV